MSEAAEPQVDPNIASVSEVFGDEPTTGAPSEPTTQTPPAGGEPAGQPAGQPPSTEPKQPTFPTADQITASVREGLRQSQGDQPTAPKQYSPEELDRLFNVYQPTPEVIQRLLTGGEDALKAFVEIREGLGRQFGTLLQYQLELAKRDLVSQMDPALKFVAEQAAAKDREDFFSQHEDLKDHELLTQTVFNALKAEGYVAPDKATAYKTLADRTRALLPTGGGNGSGGGPSAPARTTKTSPTTNRPAGLSSGSQAGGGGGSAPQAPFPGAEVYL
jgi:hypothetical protein